MSTTAAPVVTVEQVEEAIGVPFADWAQNCHSISLAIVKSDLPPFARVARGRAIGVKSQHSWVTLGEDVYDKYAAIIDPTLWSYRSDVDTLWVGTLQDEIHYPKGMGNIWDYGAPETSSYQDEFHLNTEGLSTSAKLFIQAVGPLDKRGWASLMQFPMEGWPSREIIPRILDTPELRAFVPIDLAGMLTDRNPSGLYLK